MGMNISTAQARQLGIVPKRARKAPRQAPTVPLCFVAAGLPEPVMEWRFAEHRRWRFDYAWPQTEYMIALEVDGGAWTQGRHTRGKGFIEDQRKRNAATLLGWRVFHCTPQDIRTGAAAALILEAMGLSPNPAPAP